MSLYLLILGRKKLFNVYKDLAKPNNNSVTVTYIPNTFSRILRQLFSLLVHS